MSEENNVEKKEYDFKDERLWLYIGSVFATFVTICIILIWVEAGKIAILELLFNLPTLFFIVLGAIASYFAFFNFTEIDKDKRIFKDKFFFVLLLIGGSVVSLLGGIVYLVVRLVGGYLKDEFSAPVYNNNNDKPDTYHVGKDVAGYDRIYNQDGKEITTVESIGSNGDVYGTDGNKYTKK